MTDKNRSDSSKRNSFCPPQQPPSFCLFWLFLLEAYIPFSAFSTFLILHFNISLANSLCRLYTLRFPRYANMWKRLWMVPEGILNLLVMHPLEGLTGEIVFSSRGIVDFIVRRNRPISPGCTHIYILTVSNTAVFFFWTQIFVLGTWHSQNGWEINKRK